MARTNRASGNDNVAVQAGRVHGRRTTDTTSKDTTGKDTPPPAADTTTGRVQNTNSDNAKVGIQADTVTGPIHIRM